MPEIRQNEKISHRIEGPFFIIQLINPDNLNALEGEDYIYLGELLELADKNPDVYFTILQSSGRFFSSGADFKGIAKAQEDNGAKYASETSKWLSNFVARNVYVTDVFIKHSKVLVCCLNGPAIGLSAALVALCDIVYSMNDKVYLLYPFANLGLVTEGGTAISLPLKFGANTTYERLMFNKPFNYDIMTKSAFISKNFNMPSSNTEAFNAELLKELKGKVEGLYLPSCLGMKKLLKSNHIGSFNEINSMEVNESLKYWVDGEPLRRFSQLGSKQRKHRL
ncbi:Eci1p [Saccharomyces cerevisiae x Saccharomyces kudriavzevii VIN7]|uniref:Eci1p n=1 Tax=Saccharomyces cerevisiae x Saccharomyces kudriavzevii (strain VIN7) TaxID=1095631 RepID=H0GYH9_SACCK|nr:Eci1p [Saccharomyces cerevisiae x Saccharomyces kudriavzevii VIN7]